MVPLHQEIEPTSSQERRLDAISSRYYLLIVVAVAVAAMVSLAPSLGGSFLWDDEFLVTSNASIRHIENWPVWFRAPLFEEPLGGSGSARYWRPLVTASFALEWHLAGANPALYHATNLLLYGVLVALVGLTARRYTRSSLGAALATILFAFHPTHAECAAWISGRMDLLVAIFVLASLWAFGARLRGCRVALMAELGFAALAYLSKETALLLPAFALAELLSPSSRARKPNVARWVGRALLPQLVLAGAYVFARWQWLPFGTRAGLDQSSVGTITRAALFLETLGRDYHLTIFPFPQSAQHGLIYFDSSGVPHTNAWYVGLGLVISAALTGALFLLRRRPLPLALLGTALVSLLPTSNLLSPWLLACLTFERYLLLPHVAVCLMLASLANPTARAKQACGRLRLSLSTLFFVALVGFWTWRMHVRAVDYANSVRFWNHERAINPDSSIAPWYLSTIEERPVPKLRWLQTCQRNATKRRQYREADDCQLSLTETLFNTLLDAQVTALTRLERQWAQVTNPSQRAPNTDAIVRDINVSLPNQPLRRARLRAAYPGRIESNLALLHSRLGAHDRATAFAEESLRRCKSCRWTAPLATVYAAAGNYDRAAEILEGVPTYQEEHGRVQRQIATSADYHALSSKSFGPARMHARAQSLLSLGRFGLAFSVLAPAEADVLPFPEVADDFALIAYRAGHFEVARRALLRHRTPSEVDRILAAWNVRIAFLE